MKVLFVGLGGVGQRHLRLLKAQYPEAEVYAFRTVGRNFEIDDQLVAHPDIKVAEKYGVEELETLSDALSVSPKFAVVANPTSLHFETVSEMVASGVSALVEKPISAKRHPVKNLMRAAVKNGVYIQIGYMYRFHPAFAVLNHLIGSKRLGQLICASIAVGSYMPDWHKYESFNTLYAAQESLGGGVLATEVHEIDILCGIFGAPRRVSSVGYRTKRYGLKVIDTAAITMEFGVNRRPLLVTGHLSFVQDTPVRSIEIQGTKGKVQWDILAGQITLHSEETAEVWDFHDVPRNSLFESQLRHFIDRLDKGEINDNEIAQIVNTDQTIVSLQESLISGAVREL